MRKFLKKILPPFVVSFMSGIEVYVKRMMIWGHILFNVKGATPEDAKILRTSILMSPIDMLKDLKNWKNPNLTQTAKLEINQSGVFTVRADCDDFLHVLPVTHKDLVTQIDNLLEKGDVAIDAGANIGAITVHMAKSVSQTGKVLAIEMMPDTAIQLKKNLKHNMLEWVEVIELALSEKSGQKIFAEVAEGFFGQASISEDRVISGAKKVEVSTTTLDDLTADIEQIAVIKMDLEGAEMQALQGAKKTLEKTKAIVFESWESDGGDVVGLLRANGFDISTIDGLNFLATNRSLNLNS